METLQMAPNLQEVILNVIDSALAGRPINTTGVFREALEAQSQIGWLGLLRGYWSQAWQKAYKQ
jgi:hypothetical protein